MKVLDAIVKRKSIRSFTAEQIKDEELKNLIHAANSAPISGGGLPDSDSARHIAVVQNPQILNELEEALSKILPIPNPFYGAPTLIVISAPQNKFKAEQLDSALAMQNVSIAATSMGLNSVTMNGVIYALNANQELQEKIHIPTEYSPYIALVVGYTEDTMIKNREFNDSNVSYIK